MKTEKRGPKKPGRHQWYEGRGNERGKHRRTKGPLGLVFCLRRGCRAMLGRNGRVIGPIGCQAPDPFH